MAWNQKVKIGGGKALLGKAIAVCGPGTGLGVANLLPITNKWYCFGGEGGHVDYAPIDDKEIKILRHIKTFKKICKKTRDKTQKYDNL